MKQVQKKIFAFSCHVPCYNWVRSRGFLVKIQDGNKENSIVGNFAAVLECTENKLM